MTYLQSTVYVDEAGLDLEDAAQLDWINPCMDNACDLIDEIEIMIKRFKTEELA